MIIRVSDSSDPRLADYTSLNDVHLRKHVEAERGLYMAESTKVILRAIDEGHQPRSFLTVEKWMADLEEGIIAATGHADGGDVPIFLADESMLQSIVGYHMHRGAMAAMERPPLEDPRALLARLRGGAGARRVVVLDGLVDHTNIGAIFRSAAALSVDAILVTEDCADPLYRRSVRVSMGTVFQVPWTRIPPSPEGVSILREEGFTVAALALTDNAITLDEFAARSEVTAADSRVAMLMGSEGYGLSAAAIEGADEAVIIPMAGKVDSLNVAAATAVACWELRIRNEE